MKVFEIINNKIQQMNEEIAERYIKLVELSTKAGEITWKEFISEYEEQYIVELEDFNLVAYLNYNSSTEELSLYIEDMDYNQYYLYKGKKWEDIITEIYGCMVTYTTDEEYNVNDENFIEDIDYNIETLGETIEYFQLNVNYNEEMLG